MREVGLARFAETLAWEHQARGYVAVWDELLGVPPRESLPAASATADEQPVTDSQPVARP